MCDCVGFEISRISEFRISAVVVVEKIVLTHTKHQTKQSIKELDYMKVHWKSFEYKTDNSGKRAAKKRRETI